MSGKTAAIGSTEWTRSPFEHAKLRSNRAKIKEATKVRN